MIKINKDANIIDKRNNENDTVSLEEINKDNIKEELNEIENYNKESDSYLITLGYYHSDGEVFIEYKEDVKAEEIMKYKYGREKLAEFNNPNNTNEEENNLTILPRQ